ncbi:MAG: tetratricopeptide repeat protein, partial [Myxococcales bacterium]|nr:tetratricopeptide repeat protein [Myxococcales bacterium]
TWTRVAPRLDDYADGWARVSRGLCEAQQQATRSDLVVEHGRACLERSRAALDALAEALEQPGAQTIDRAVTAAASLPEPARCEDAELLLAELRPPDAAIADAVAEQRERLSRARALEDAGRFDDAEAIADAVLVRAEALRYAPLRAEALLRRGTTRLWAGRGEAADEDLGEASFLAIQTDHEAVAAEAAARRIYVRGELRGRPAEAAIELPWAEALVGRVGDPRLRALLLNNAGAVKVRSGDGPGGLALLQQALELDRSILPPGHPDIALALANVGRVERDLGHGESAVITLRQAATAIETALGPRHPYRAMVATMLGSVAIDVGRYAEAEVELDLADSIEREAQGAPMPRYFVLRAQGELALRRRQWSRAREAFEAALALAEPQVGAEHPMLADARFGLAHAELAQGRIDDAVEHTRAALERLELALGGSHPNVISGLVQLGRRQLEAGRVEDARATFERARELAAAAEPVDAAGIAWIDCWQGRSWLASEEPGRAEPLLRGCVEALPEGEPRRVEAMVALAAALRLGGDPSGAVDCLARAEARLSRWRAADDPELAWARFRLAQARYEAAGDGAARGKARQSASDSYAQVVVDPGWSAEASEARTWLDGIASGEPPSG